MARRFVYFQGAREKKRPIVFFGSRGSFEDFANRNELQRQFLREIMAPMPEEILVPAAMADLTSLPTDVFGNVDTRFFPYWPVDFNWLTDILTDLGIPWRRANLATGQGYWFLPTLDPGNFGGHPTQAALTVPEQLNLFEQANIHGAILCGAANQWTTPGGSNDRYLQLFRPEWTGQTINAGINFETVDTHSSQVVTPGTTIFTAGGTTCCFPNNVVPPERTLGNLPGGGNFATVADMRR